MRINDFPKKIGDAFHEDMETLKTKGGEYYMHRAESDKNRNTKDEFYRFIAR